MAVNRQLAKLVPALLASAARGAGVSTCSPFGLQAMLPAFKILGEQASSSLRSSLHTSCPAQAEITDASQAGPVKLYEPERKFRPLADKELWHEAWMYEDRFGSEDDPIVVPSLESERIIGVTDPEDDNLVVWGILRAGEAPRQFIENGEYYVLKKVPYVAKVGDVIELLEGGSAKISK